MNIDDLISVYKVVEAVIKSNDVWEDKWFGTSDNKWDLNFDTVDGAKCVIAYPVNEKGFTLTEFPYIVPLELVSY